MRKGFISDLSQEAALERTRLLIVLTTVAVNIVGVIFLSFMPWSNWRSGLGLNIIDNLILFIYLFRTRDKTMAHLILFGLALGFVELIADAYLVDVTKTLDYSIGGGPMIWRSPGWMPFAWEVVGVQFGYIGMRLVETFKKFGWLIAGILGGINIPFYEEMALRTHWWRYANCKMFLHTPYYIILGEFAIVIGMAFLARAVRRQKITTTIFAGVAMGIAIFPCYALAFWLSEKI